QPAERRDARIAETYRGPRDDCEGASGPVAEHGRREPRSRVAADEVGAPVDDGCAEVGERLAEPSESPGQAVRGIEPHDRVARSRLTAAEQVRVTAERGERCVVRRGGEAANDPQVPRRPG